MLRLWCCCLSDCPGVEERSFNWSAGSACWRTTQKRRRTNEETRKFFIQSDFIISQSPNDGEDDEARNKRLNTQTNVRMIFWQVEMEHKRETDIEDYWLIQYQRLLESKPLTLLEKVRVLS